MTLRIISDMHGHIDKFKRIVNSSDAYWNFQLGDLGFKEHWEQLHKFDLRNTTIIPGNHDDYDYLKAIRNTEVGKKTVQSYTSMTLGKDPINILLIRGAESFDKDLRTIGYDWWSQEQLSAEDCANVIITAEQLQPDLILSHDCPFSIANEICTANRDKTKMMLEGVLEVCKPSLWVFGHHHKEVLLKRQDVEFRCIPQEEYIDISVERKVSFSVAK